MSAAQPLPTEYEIDWSQPVRMPFEQFLGFIENAQEKYEYEDGQVIPLTRLIADSGGTMEHSTIKVNLVSELRAKVTGSGCRALDADMAVKRRGKRQYYFPDASVVCDTPELDPAAADRCALNNPIAVFEVVSKTTAERDRSRKLESYQAFDSIKTYVIIESLRVGVQILDRSRDGEWRIDYVTEPDGVIRIPSTGIELSLAELYRDVELWDKD
jgi:Uma2 family endonuclease